MTDMITTGGTVDWGWVIFLILILWFFVGGGFGGFGSLGRANAFLAGDIYGNRPYENPNSANCEVERRQLVTAAETNFRIIDQANLTRATVAAEAANTNAKIDFYAYQDLRDKLSEQQRENMMLQNKLYSDAKFGAIESQLACIAHKMAVKPEVYTASAVCPNAAIINGLGINSTPCGYGYNGNGNVLS